jgi:molybdenum cofactor biosynthesis protein B
MLTYRYTGDNVRQDPSANPTSRPTHSTLHEATAAERAKRDPVSCAVLTVSDTRTMETDIGGAIIEKFVRQAGHLCAARRLVPDDPSRIDAQLREWLADPDIQAILITGGTGISHRDTTIEVVRRLLCVELEGFGELFRMLSYQQVQGAAMLSRAVAGLVVRSQETGSDAFIFAMPGSPNAVETAMSKLIAPQLSHLVWERTRHR